MSWIVLDKVEGAHLVPHIDIDQALLGLALARVAIDRTEIAQIPGNCIGGKP